MPGITLEDTASKALAASMSGLAARQRVVGNNLANIDTPGFKASEVSFARQLADVTAADAGPTLQMVATDPRHLPLDGSTAGVEITTNTGTTQRLDGNNVDMEREMETLSETVMHYQAAARVVSRRLGMLRAAITGGSR